MMPEVSSPSNVPWVQALLAMIGAPGAEPPDISSCGTSASRRDLQ